MSKSEPKLAYILSLPRSGSTVLSAMLDKRRGIVSPPESSFPQVLGVVPKKWRTDKRMMAALYLDATFVPTPLDLEEAMTCMEGSDHEILTALGLKVAEKLGRSPDQVKAIVWKTPRTIGLHRGPLSAGGKFLILRRNPHNVFESQFRVGFGENNRKPFRFSVFRESYELAFSKLPPELCMDVHYDDLPGIIPDIVRFIGIDDCGEWESYNPSLGAAAKECYWMKEVTGEFVNKDPEKRNRLNPDQVKRLDSNLKLARPIRPFLGPVRNHFDWNSMNRIFMLAQKRIAESPAG